MSIEKCDRCHEFIINQSGVCHCKPFKIINDDSEEVEVWADDNEAAALKYAKQINSSDPDYLLDSTIDILVNGVGFRIGAEPDIHYFARSL